MQGLAFNSPNYSYRDNPEVHSTHEPLINLTAAISVEDLTVRLSTMAEPALIKLTLRLETSSITMVTGPVGSGKTTLLRSILGELPYSGNISVSSTQIGYCAQTPWLQNGTIQQNICGFEDEEQVDIVWYRRVLQACALDEDLAALDGGDHAVVGSRGVTLSGGQRQRVVSSSA